MSRTLIAFLLASLALSGCKKDEQIKLPTEGVAADAATSINGFAVDMYQNLSTKEGNIFFSPASISIALAMTWTGAGGATADEMASVLHLTADRNKVLSDHYKLLAGLAGSDSTYTLKAANRIWGAQSFSFKPAFNSDIQTYFSGDAKEMDFVGQPNNERLTINQWVADQTDDKIRNLLPAGSITQDTRLVLTNAVYFLGDWVYPFAANLTRDEDFHTADSATVKTPTMKLKKDLLYYSDDSLAIVALPYEGHDLEFLVILPNDKNGLSKIEASLSTASLQKNIAAMRSQKMNVWLPKLDLSQSFKLNTTLDQMGMKRPFSPQSADFSGISEQRNLFISSVVHKSFLKVDEKGTEAAAATGVSIAVTSMPTPSKPPIAFIADHPFLFLIREKDTGLILFMGRLENPQL